MLTKVKKAIAKGDSSPAKKMQARMSPKPAKGAGTTTFGNMTVKPAPAKAAAVKKKAAPAKEPAFSADFFAVMDEMDVATGKRRAAAVKLMQKAAVKK